MNTPPKSKTSLLLVDDDPEAIEYLTRYFSKRLFDVSSAQDGEAGQRMALAKSYDIIILDNAMPKRTGFQVCTYLRTVGITTPIIVLSGKSDTMTKTGLLNVGADDYVTKPYHVEELFARVQAVLRNTGAVTMPEPLLAGDVVMDRSSHIVTRDGCAVYLTRKEFKILEFLMERKGLLVPRDAMIKHVWGVYANTSLHTLDTHLANLRKKLCIGDRMDIIVTVPGVGYQVL